jgi:hypothetical protein
MRIKDFAAKYSRRLVSGRITDVTVTTNVRRKRAPVRRAQRQRAATTRLGAPLDAAVLGAIVRSLAKGRQQSKLHGSVEPFLPAECLIRKGRQGFWCDAAVGSKSGVWSYMMLPAFTFRFTPVI